MDATIIYIVDSETFFRDIHEKSKLASTHERIRKGIVR